jgi:hypothetical protein
MLNKWQSLMAAKVNATVRIACVVSTGMVWILGCLSALKLGTSMLGALKLGCILSGSRLALPTFKQQMQSNTAAEPKQDQAQNPSKNDGYLNLASGGTH